MSEEISFRIDKDRWLRLCEKPGFDDILIRAARINPKIRVVPDTSKDRAQQTDARGFVRIRQKREYDFLV